jgi:fumarate reductase flavoprotein subunit
MSAADYDVIVVGTGIAGHCAALEALKAGARVLMVDSEDKTGGSSRLSGGMIMGANTRYQRSRGITDDSPTLLYRQYMAENQWKVQPSVAKRLCYEAGTTVDWLEDHGIVYVDLSKAGGEPYPRGHVTAGGNSIVNALAGRVGQFDRVDTALKTRVDRLAMNDGAVTGIYANEDGVTAGAVVLAMGGMGGDLDMMARWHGAAFAEAAKALFYVGEKSSRGDAIRIAQQIDAQVIANPGSRTINWPFGGAYLPGYVMVVNGLGRRFYDESTSYNIADVIYAAQPGATGYGIFDDAAKQAITSYDDVAKCLTVILPETESMQMQWLAGAVDDNVATGRVIKADTLEMLAARLGVPFENLNGSIVRYNGDVARGQDDDYLKPAKHLRPVSTPPFYAFPIHLSTIGVTATGIRVDHNACVVHRDSRSIPGLFAAGECTGGVLGSMYVGSGNSLANCSTYGRIAGRNAAALALHGAVPAVDWKAIGADG